MITRSQALDFANGAAFHIAQARDIAYNAMHNGSPRLPDLVPFNANWAADDLLRTADYMREAGQFDTKIVNALRSDAVAVRTFGQGAGDYFPIDLAKRHAAAAVDLLR